MVDVGGKEATVRVAVAEATVTMSPQTRDLLFGGGLEKGDALAMTAASIAALTIYDMVKGTERGVEIGPVRLLHKSGGRSGAWNR